MDDSLDYCTGSLVVHVDEWIECTDPTCEVFTIERHEWVLRCEEEWDDCACRDVEPSRTTPLPTRAAA